MKYSPPFRKLDIDITSTRRIRWGASNIIPYWNPTETWTPAASGETRIPVDLATGWFLWLYGVYVHATTDCTFSLENEIGTVAYRIGLTVNNARNYLLQSNTPLMGMPSRITSGNRLRLRATFPGGAPTITYNLLMIVNNVADYEERT